MSICSIPFFMSYNLVNNGEILSLQPLRGNVGIGQIAPYSLLHIANNGKTSLIIEKSNGIF